MRFPKATLRAGILIYLGSVFACPGICESVYPRDIAASHIEESIAGVRKNMDSNPSIVADLFGDALAIPVGDDPRVLAICAEVIAQSHNPQSIQSAIGAIGIIITRWHPAILGVSKWQHSVDAALEPALKNSSEAVRLHAAQTLAYLGGDQEKRAYAILSSALSGENREIAYRYMLLDFGDRSEIIDMALSRARYSKGDEADRAFADINTILQSSESPSKHALTKNQNKRVIAFLEETMSGADGYRSLLAAETLPRVLPEDKERARAAYRRVISSPIDKDDARTRAKALDVIYKEELVESTDAKDVAALRAAERENGLLTMFEAETARINGRAAQSYRRSVAIKWRALLQ